jgi:hypothetical protein
MAHSRKRLTVVVFLVAMLLMCALLAYTFLRNDPPPEKSLLSNFYAHRASYERLRDMLREDKKLLRVATWGVETTESVPASKPPEGTFPLNRYNEYLVLLGEIGAVGAFRGREGESKEVGVMMYASGFAGDTRHVTICWLEVQPTHQVGSLDEFYRTPKPRTPVYRHIDENWYLWADW